MELEILWTQLAEDKLQDIFFYYKHKASLKIARKIINEIVDKTIDLNRNPKMGQIEDLLIEREQEFRYLVSGNYKEAVSKGQSLFLFIIRFYFFGVTFLKS